MYDHTLYPGKNFLFIVYKKKHQYVILKTALELMEFQKSEYAKFKFIIKENKVTINSL